jgi:hypothetical protein
MGQRDGQMTLFRVKQYDLAMPYSSRHITRLVSLPFGIAINPNSYQYLILKTEPKLNGNLLYLDQIEGKLLKDTTPSCIKALFENRATEVSAHSSHIFITNGLKPSILPIDKSRVILTNLTAAVFKSTGKEDIQIESCQQCVITIPCNASLVTEVGIIPGDIQSCQGHISADSIQFPINLSALLRYFSSDKLQAIHGDLLFQEHLNTAIPQFDFQEKKNIWFFIVLYSSLINQSKTITGRNWNTQTGEIRTCASPSQLVYNQPRNQ